MTSRATDTFSTVFEHHITNIHVALPGQIESYDASQCRASVQPLIKKKLLHPQTQTQNGQILSMPIINNVPVIFPTSKNSGITFHVEPGDTVLLIFCERNIGNWLINGGEVEPADSRKFDLSDAVAVPGLKYFNDESIEDINGTLLKNKRAKILLNNENKIAIGNDEAELLDLFGQLLDAAINAANFDAFKTELPTIKAQLESIKGSL